jgi:hypothetical protein
MIKKEGFMKSTIKLIGIIIFLTLIAFPLSALGGADKSKNSGADRRADLQGDWEVGNSYYPTYFQLNVVDGAYSLELTGGGGDHIYCELLSYDGSTAVLKYEHGTMTFTAKIKGKTLVISGMADDNDNYEYFAKFNGSYTKLESAQSYDDGER